MQLLGNGADWASHKPLAPTTDEEVLGRRVAASLRYHVDTMRVASEEAGKAKRHRAEVERIRHVDLSDPIEAGWTFLRPAEQDHAAEWVRALRPLALARGMAHPDSPLVYERMDPDDWPEWVGSQYSTPGLLQKPYYVLILGGPEEIPFGFQSFLGSAGAAVGRLHLESPDSVARYVEKVLRLEGAADPAVEPEAVFFGTDHGPNDATHYCRRHMVEPLADRVLQSHGLTVTRLVGPEATKPALCAAACGHRPALVYTASHGHAAPSSAPMLQLRYNGALCCQGAKDDKVWTDSLFSIEDVPQAEPFLEGAVFFQFACFGAGTPAESDFEHWLDGPSANAGSSFVAALPTRFLEHPRGPIAFVGHADLAWTHGFLDDPEHPDVHVRWQARMEPFVRAVDELLRVQPVGLAMQAMTRSADVQNATLTNTFDRLRRRRQQMTPELCVQLAMAFVRRNDARNYMVLGDPAARLRIPLRG